MAIGSSNATTRELCGAPRWRRMRGAGWSGACWLARVCSCHARVVRSVRTCATVTARADSTIGAAATAISWGPTVLNECVRMTTRLSTPPSPTTTLTSMRSVRGKAPVTGTTASAAAKRGLQVRERVFHGSTPMARGKPGQSIRTLSVLAQAHTWPRMLAYRTISFRVPAHAQAATSPPPGDPK